MTVTVTPVLAGTYTHVSDVEADDDADAIATIPHGLGATPSVVIITPLAAEAQVSLWFAGTVNATNVVLTKTTDVGSGGAGNQVRMIASLPHSLVS